MPHTITKLATQGAASNWVKNFTLAFSYDNVNWFNYTVDGIPKVGLEVTLDLTLLFRLLDRVLLGSAISGWLGYSCSIREKPVFGWFGCRTISTDLKPVETVEKAFAYVDWLQLE